MITICKRCMETAEERILIGNGFQDLNQKEENRKLQQYVFEIAKRKNSRESVLLVENYYHELAVSYISDRLGEDSLYLDELERSKKRTGIKEENYMRLCTGI